MAVRGTREQFCDKLMDAWRATHIVYDVWENIVKSRNFGKLPCSDRNYLIGFYDALVHVHMTEDCQQQK